MNSDSDRGLVPRAPEVEGEQGELFPRELLQQMIAVERERIDSANRRTDVAKLAIESNDAADKRQYEYHMARLRSSNEDKARRHVLASKLFLG